MCRSRSFPQRSPVGNKQTVQTDILICEHGSLDKEMGLKVLRLFCLCLQCFHVPHYHILIIALRQIVKLWNFFLMLLSLKQQLSPKNFKSQCCVNYFLII